MKLCRFDEDRLGVVIGNMVHDVTGAQDEIRRAARYDMKGDPVIAALETASAAGVIVVSSSGNGASVLSNGFDPATVNSAGAAPSAITVGAIYNDRFFVVVQWQSADKKSLQSFVSALQQRFQHK